MDSTLTIQAGKRHRAVPEQEFLPGLGLVRARVHEFCGFGRRTTAMMLAARMDGPVFWIAPAWEPDRLNGEGMRNFTDPGRFVFFHPIRAEDILWSMEEALRSGIVPLVVADLPGPPALTPVRRLHLAAETGMAEGRVAPLGVLLTGVTGGAPGVESRWHMTQTHAPDRPGWQLTRQRARTAPPKSWRVSPKKDGFGVEPAQDDDDIAATQA